MEVAASHHKGIELLSEIFIICKQDNSNRNQVGGSDSRFFLLLDVVKWGVSDTHYGDAFLSPLLEEWKNIAGIDHNRWQYYRNTVLKL